MSALGLLKVQGDLWCLQILNFLLSLSFGSADRVRGKTQKNNLLAENFTQNSGKNKAPKILKITGLGTRLRSIRKTNNIHIKRYGNKTFHHVQISVYIKPYVDYAMLKTMTHAFVCCPNTILGREDSTL